MVKRTPQVAAFLSQARERMLDKADGSTYTLTVGDAMEVLRGMLPWGTDAPVLTEYATLRERLREASVDLTGDGLGPIPTIDPDEAADIVEELSQATPQRVADWLDRTDGGEKVRLSMRNGEDNANVVNTGVFVGYRGEPTVLIKLAPHTYTSWPLGHVTEEGAGR